ncbi:hypothetical protein MSAN_01791800 [Mycena sanguinolenta]|uniref:WD40 repeat-like protein n=1 Tax=Mycena sanguinolenta TaxID=230812 RepID=A0A8H6XUI2_9AGAR|nr:hypothetical protein MSAN_01791800 [Mycena sanguinolenta]
MPPRELPGFYFDAERNRYFPLTSRPPSSSGNNSPSVNLKPKVQDSKQFQPPRRRHALWTCPARETTSAGRTRETSAVRHLRLASTSRGCSESVRWPFVGGGQRICAFKTTSTRQFLGDAHGWLYSRVASLSSDLDSCDDMDRWTAWTPELSLAPHSEISALCTTSTRCVAVCFDVSTKICVQDAEVPDRTQLLHLPTVRDVRAASLQGRALVLGAADKAVLITDLDASNNAVRMLPTRSDVFTVAHQENLIYAGTRAGTVLRFDTRVNNSKGAQVLFESGGVAGRSSAVFAQPIHGGEQLVLGYMDGRLGTYDLRFARPAAQPVVTYAGHPSSLSCSGRLGLALDPSERFLFAAGADHRLRAWALNSGAPVVPPTGSGSPPPSPLPDNGDALHKINPFATLFTTPFVSLQVVDADDGPGQVLWACGGSEVWCWRLGL